MSACLKFWQALPNLKLGFYQIAESCEIAADSADRASSGDGGPHAAGDSAAGEEAPGAAPGCASPPPDTATETSLVQQAAADGALSGFGLDLDLQ